MLFVRVSPCRACARACRSINRAALSDDVAADDDGDVPALPLDRSARWRSAPSPQAHIAAPAQQARHRYERFSCCVSVGENALGHTPTRTRAHAFSGIKDYARRIGQRREAVLMETVARSTTPGVALASTLRLAATSSTIDSRNVGALDDDGGAHYFDGGGFDVGDHGDDVDERSLGESSTCVVLGRRDG